MSEMLDNIKQSHSKGILIEVIQLLKPLWSAEQIREEFGDACDMLLCDWFNQYPDEAVELGRKLDLKILIVQSGFPNRPASLVYDGRYVEGVSNYAGVAFVIISQDGNVAYQVGSEKMMPSLKVNLQCNKPYAYKPLWKLLSWPFKFKTPKNLDELKTFFKMHPIPNDTRVRVAVICMSQKGKFYYATQLWFGKITATKKLLLRARPGNRYNLIFGPEVLPPMKKRRLTEDDTSENIADDFAHPSKKPREEVTEQNFDSSTWPVDLQLRLETLKDINELGLLSEQQVSKCFEEIKNNMQSRIQSGSLPRKVASMTTSKVPSRRSNDLSTSTISIQANARNRSAAARLYRKGLNAAYDLGMVSAKEFQEISNALASTDGAFACGYDSAQKLKYLAYADKEESFSMNVPSASIKWNEETDRFFSNLQVRRKVLTETRRIILNPLTDKISRYTDTGSNKACKFSWCLNDLKHRISKQHIVMFCTSDRDLQNLKFLWGTFASMLNQKGSFRVNLIMTSANELCAMITRDYCLFNTYHYVDFSKEDLFDQAAAALCSTEKRPSSREDGLAFCNFLLSTWTSLGKLFLEHFCYDMNSVGFMRLSQISSQAVSAKTLSESGPLDQGMERLKPFYNKAIRSFCRGGMTFSEQCAIQQGDPILEGSSRKVEMVMELDLVSSYGFSASNSLLPNGFCVGYVSKAFEKNVTSGNYTFSDNSDETLSRMDSLRSSSFEFRATYYTLWKLSVSEIGRSIRRVFSNYHPIGVFAVNKHILDLTVVFDDGSLLLFNFDSAWTHGCQTCAPLDSYVNGSSCDELVIRSTTRDLAIRKWLRACGLNENVYRVLTDCHDTEYSPKHLKAVFKREPVLAHLLQTVPVSKNLSTKQLFDWLKSKRDDRSFTYLAFIRGCTGEPIEVTPVVLPFVDSHRGNMLAKKTGSVPIMVSRENFEYLVYECQFEMESIDAILFFGIDTATNRTFHWLVEERRKTTNLVFASLFKNVTNLSVGYFGINEMKEKPKYFLTNAVPKHFDHLKHEVMVVTDCHEEFIAYKLKAPRDITRETKRNNSLAKHASVIENGKLRLVSFLNFIQSHLIPGSYRFLYCNVDNVIIALSSQGFSNLVVPHRRMDFVNGLAKYFSDENYAGSFMVKWKTGEGFKFATAKIQNYAVITSDLDRFKCSGINNLSTEEGYQFTMDLLTTCTGRVVQQRRTHKPTSLDVTNKTLVFNKHPI